MPDPWRNRIVGQGVESPEQLLANPRNWRIHPKAQQDALAGVLSEVGWVQNIIVNQRTGHVVDGHARVEIAISRGEAEVPVVYVDLDENEEGVILAALDPLAGMAVTDPEKWAELLAEISVTDEALRAMLGNGEGVEPVGFPVLADGDRAPFQQMTFTLADEQAKIVTRAVKEAIAAGPFVGSPNENGNGNALARIAEAYIGAR